MSSNIQTDDGSTVSNTTSEAESDSGIDTSDMTREEVHNEIARVFLEGEFDDPDVVEHAWELWKQDRYQITKFIDAYRDVCLDEGEGDADAEE